MAMVGVERTQMAIPSVPGRKKETACKERGQPDRLSETSSHPLVYSMLYLENNPPISCRRTERSDQCGSVESHYLTSFIDGLNILA